jgi:hypothetical protein
MGASLSCARPPAEGDASKVRHLIEKEREYRRTNNDLCIFCFPSFLVRFSPSLTTSFFLYRNCDLKIGPDDSCRAPPGTGGGRNSAIEAPQQHLDGQAPLLLRLRPARLFRVGGERRPFSRQRRRFAKLQRGRRGRGEPCRERRRAVAAPLSVSCRRRDSKRRKQCRRRGARRRRRDLQGHQRRREPGGPAPGQGL